MDYSRVKSYFRNIGIALICFTAILVLPLFLVYSNAERHRACFGQTCVKIELADTPAKRELGLMFRNGMANDSGMLFVFEQEGLPSFWMKNMKFPLDIIWIDNNKRIVDITENAQPCTQHCPNIIPKITVRYALELNSGFVATNRLKVGDAVNF